MDSGYLPQSEQFLFCPLTYLATSLFVVKTLCSSRYRIRRSAASAVAFFLG